jgi:hypothetical protein
MPAQAQKHVTHNEALERLDLLVQLVVEGFDATTPPAAPQSGQIWALGAGATGEWSGQDGTLAAWQAGGWQFMSPQPGWCAASATELRLWTGSAWQSVGPTSFDNLPGVGINASADATNKLAVAAEASLFNHDGAGHQVKVNKTAPGDTASLLFQTGFSGRAEMGTLGNDDFAVKVSADGATWATGLVIDRVTGRVTCPAGVSVDATVTGLAVTQTAQDPTPGRLLKVGDFGLGLDDGDGPDVTDLDAHRLSGLFRFGAATGAPAPSGVLIHMAQLGNGAAQTQIALGSDGGLYTRHLTAGIWSGWGAVWGANNTTVDANGFVKQASPIVRLLVDGTEEPAQPVGARFVRQGTGDYLLHDVAPLATSGWQVEAPQDANGNRLVFVETAYDPAARCLRVQTTAPTWSADRQGWVAGSPRDIPEGRWVDLRFAVAARADAA